MQEKKSFAERAESFLNGKGFYIVLFVCIAVIGVSAWLLIFSEFSPLAPSDDEGDYVPTMGSMGDVPPPTDPAETDPSTNPDPSTNLGTSANPGTSTKPGVSKPSEKPQPASPNDPGDTLTVVEPPAESANPSTPETSKTDTPKSDTDKTDTPKTNTDKPKSDGKTDKPKTDTPKVAKTLEELSFIWPLQGSVSVPYSPMALLYDRTMGDWRTHNGVDIAASMGAKVMAVSDGTVTEICEDPFYGTTVVIDHGAGAVSRYSNLQSVPTVQEGDSVTMGSVIGAVGNTALCEAGDVSHLHFVFTVDGETADPSEYFPKKS